ncbi:MULTISPECIES: hypothetical protein [Nocardiopsis]|uniref:Uncharacterized protein n=1 Tax=Nocardiopsis sinuspersici TaxID=501010 RepID=A0A1V3C2H1_9ACTN|nr:MULTISPECIES: hypothetical protein [Nocardiopsis]NYH51233.1 hypothetical protein [Nocardiopsis sinuspersici]OOC55004.1 hypothetical protein NOSIN_15320 [Nocardiopsis sinuspersici]
MKLRNKVAAIATTALAVSGVTMTATPAQADLVTLCSGHGGAITLPTDLAVPAGKSCFLDGTVVQGDVTVRKGANLHIVGGEIEGRVTVQKDGYFDAQESSVSDRVVNRGSYGTYMEDSSAGAALRTVPVEGGNTDGFAYVVDSSVRSINAEVGAVYVSGSRVNGAFKADGVEYVDVYDSVVRGDLSVTAPNSGGILCDSEVIGAATYTGGSGPVAVGAGEKEGFCSSVNYVDGDLSVTGVSGGVYVDNNIVGGDLVTSGNTPTAQVGDHNRVRGDILTEEVALRTFSATVVEEFEAHEDGLAEEVEQARSETIEDAMAAGSAF